MGGDGLLSDIDDTDLLGEDIRESDAEDATPGGEGNLRLLAPPRKLDIRCRPRKVIL